MIVLLTRREAETLPRAVLLAWTELLSWAVLLLAWTELLSWSVMLLAWAVLLPRAELLAWAVLLTLAVVVLRVVPLVILVEPEQMSSSLVLRRAVELCLFRRWRRAIVLPSGRFEQVS